MLSHVRMVQPRPGPQAGRPREGTPEGEVPVTRIQEQLGLEQANISQHLAVLRAKQIVVGRKEGNQVFYSIRSPLLIEVLDTMRHYFEEHLEESLAMLDEIKNERTVSA